jgi:hypothetical protein
MKFVLVDYTNNGVVFLAESNNNLKVKWDFNILKSCILDTYIVPSTNNSLTLNYIQETFVFLKNGDLIPGNTGELNATFLFKQKKAELIYPLISKLNSAIITQSFKYIPEFYFPIDDTLAYQLAKCNPEKNEYSTGVVRYAQTVGMSNEEAYTELSLEVDTIHAIKLRAYANVKKYENLIREVSTKEQADTLLEEIQQKLIRECQI